MLEGCGDSIKYNLPDPLECERKTPAEVSINAYYSSDNTRREKNACSPTHTNIGSDVGSENGRDDFRSVRGRESLFVSAGLL